MSDREEKTYLAKAESRRHLILVTLTKEQATYEAIDATGVVFDRTVPTPMITSFDPEVARRDFPILGKSFRGKPLAYLDNAATSQKPNRRNRCHCQPLSGIQRQRASWCIRSGGGS